jgi:hypothetical protein
VSRSGLSAQALAFLSIASASPSWAHGSGGRRPNLANCAPDLTIHSDSQHSGTTSFRLYSGSWQGRLAVTSELAHWRSVTALGHSQDDSPARADLEGTVLPDDYLTAADELISHAHRQAPNPRQIPSGGEAAYRAEAQVKAIQAVAAAIDRLAAAVEALSPPSPPPVSSGHRPA